MFKDSINTSVLTIPMNSSPSYPLFYFRKLQKFYTWCSPVPHTSLYVCYMSMRVCSFIVFLKI